MYKHCPYIYRRMNSKKIWDLAFWDRGYHFRDCFSRFGTGGIIFVTASLVAGHEKPGPDNGRSP
jgi:hypothetical protein